MTAASRETTSRGWVLPFLAALVVVLATILSAATASAVTTGVAETRVRASSVVVEVPVGPPEYISAGQRLGNDVAEPGIVVATGVAANTGPRTLFHYTDEAGQRGILDSGRLNPSLKSVSPKDARYGDGQYLSDIVPGTKTCAQLARCFLGRPFPAQKYTHYVEIDVTDLNIIKGRDGVFLNPSGEPLDITSRMISAGMN